LHRSSEKTNCIKCEKEAVCRIDMTPEFFSILYYCNEHLPVGFNGIIPEENKILKEM
jgi:hypothetical protein